MRFGSGGAANPEATQETIVLLSSNLATVSLLGGTAVALRHFDRRAETGAAGLNISAGVAWGAGVGGLAAACGVAALYVDQHGALDAAVLGTAAAVVAWLVVCVLLEASENIAAIRSRRQSGAAQAGHLGDCDSPGALGWPLSGRFFSSDEAFQGAILIAPGVTMTVGNIVAIWSRRRIAGRGADSRSHTRITAPPSGRTSHAPGRGDRRSAPSPLSR